jgi:hypothetical protein
VTETLGTRECLVAIHQPNFLPWLGYFDKLARADVFVLLDHVQFPKKAGTWMNRTRLLVQGKPRWVTVPVVRAYHGLRSVKEMRIDQEGDWRTKLLRTIEQSYSRAPFFAEVMPLVTELVKVPTDALADFNEAGVRGLADALSLDSSKLVRSSTLAVGGHSTELLIELTRAVGGTAYLAGGGASGYQEDERFPAAGIRLELQRFEPPTYPQLSPEPEPGLSVVDAMMNCGFAGTRELLA